MANDMDTPRRVSGPATYVYCAVQAARRPVPKRGHAGVPGADSPRVLPVSEGVWLLVSSAPIAEYGEAAIAGRLRDLDWVSRCAMAHEVVVEDAARSGAVVPMKLFTIFSSDARATAHVGRSGRKLARLFALVAGRQEWGVRASLDEQRAARGPAPARASSASGTAFLLRKKEEKDAVRRGLETAVAETERVFADLSRVAVEARRRTPAQKTPERRLLLDAAFLVATKDAKGFKSAVAKHARARRDDGLEIALTGPWPAYTFVSESA